MTGSKIVERQRNEIMVELRHLRSDERPVNGQANRERIKSYLRQIQERQQANARLPSSQSIVPSAHKADIDALTNRRCVSAVLSSMTFRQNLENTNRRSVDTRTVPTIQQIAQTPLMLPMAEPSTRTIPNRVVNERLRSQDHEDSLVSSILTHRFASVSSRSENQSYTWESITQWQREMIVLEINDLVHRQLVSTALESGFRTNLERNILNRLQRGTPLTRTVHPTPIRTNPIQTRNSSVHDISTQFDSMQQTLQLMFSMQMEMQRLLRQEVASAFANNSIMAMTSSSQPINSGYCTICLNTLADTVLYRCGHLCVCYMCGLNLRETNSVNGVRCPICRAPIDDILRVYRSGRDVE